MIAKLHQIGSSIRYKAQHVDQLTVRDVWNEADALNEVIVAIES